MFTFNCKQCEQCVVQAECSVCGKQSCINCFKDTFKYRTLEHQTTVLKIPCTDCEFFKALEEAGRLRQNVYCGRCKGYICKDCDCIYDCVSCGNMYCSMCATTSKNCKFGKFLNFDHDYGVVSCYNCKKL